MRLRDEYTGVVDALPDVTVGSDVTGTLHRPDGDGDAWCGILDDAEYHETEIALAYGGELCRGCFRASLEHLARSEESPVRRVDGLDEAPSTDDVDPETPIDADGRAITHAGRLGSLTADVVVSRGSAATAFHAPDADGEPACGCDLESPHLRRVDHAPPSTHPCRYCFAEEIVDEFSPRDADLAEAAEVVRRV